MVPYVVIYINLVFDDGKNVINNYFVLNVTN